jgi:lipid-binding SYLF domain-containing protein
MHWCWHEQQNKQAVEPKDKTMKATSLMTRAVQFVAIFAMALATFSAQAATQEELDQEADETIKMLLENEEAARKMNAVAKGVLIFPDVIKAGFLIGGQYGNGVLREEGKTTGYYNTAAGSYGLQAGAQKFGYVMMFMTDTALEYLHSSSGWEVGIGPSIVVVDAGIAKSLTTTSAKDDIYVFFVDQKGLMAGLGVQGSKITKINPDK